MGELKLGPEHLRTKRFLGGRIKFAQHGDVFWQLSIGRATLVYSFKIKREGGHG